MLLAFFVEPSSSFITSIGSSFMYSSLFMLLLLLLIGFLIGDLFVFVLGEFSLLSEYEIEFKYI